jgi:hypothetical protein
MNERESVRIETAAAKALAEWKAFFAQQVCKRAKQLASQSDQPQLITLSHFRQAAETALQSLSAAIRDEADGAANQEAA